MIAIHFPHLADSPTGHQRVRIRYTIVRGADGVSIPVLRYGHGAEALTADDWAAFRKAGATITTDSDRERAILKEVLGDAT